MKKQKSNCSRRGFIQKTATGAAGLMALPLARKAHGETAAPKEKSRVVVVKHDDALKNYVIQQDIVGIMIDAGITSLTGVSNVNEAWRGLFPGITRNSIIGIKINCLFSSMPTHPKVTFAMVDSLKKMTVDGNLFPENNIIVWDQEDGHLRNCGYKINRSAAGVRYFGTGGDWAASAYKVDGAGNLRLSRILVEECNYLINLCVLKQHNTTGVSFSMKNHLGSVDNPGALHGGTPSIPSLNAQTPIREKQVLCICDAMYALRYGPDGTPDRYPKSIILSKDMVAHDYVAMKMLESNDVGTSYMTQGLRYITAAANAPYSLGTCNPDQIEEIPINNPTDISSNVEEDINNDTIPCKYFLRQNYPNPFNQRTIISYELPESSEVSIHVTNAKGQRVNQLFEGRQGPGVFRVDWDGTDQNGSHLSSGIYICVFQTKKTKRTIKMQMIQ